MIRCAGCGQFLRGGKYCADCSKKLRACAGCGSTDIFSVVGFSEGGRAKSVGYCEPCAPPERGD
jgi:hypothetical protein